LPTAAVHCSRVGASKAPASTSSSSSIVGQSYEPAS
jgi:hypothetical protein